MTITVKNLIESSHYNIDLDISSDTDMTNEEISVINDTVDKFLMLNNTQYENLFNKNYVKFLIDNLQEKIKTKIVSFKIYDTIKTTKKMKVFYK